MNKLLIVISSLIIILFLALLIYRLTRKRWMCTENGCEYDIDGDYNSKSECLSSCKKKLEEKMYGAWTCSANDYKCVRSDSGYTSKELCEENCGNPYLYQPSYYYPQSLWYPGNFRRGGRGGRGGRGVRWHR